MLFILTFSGCPALIVSVSFPVSACDPSQSPHCSLQAYLQKRFHEMIRVGFTVFLLHCMQDWLSRIGYQVPGLPCAFKKCTQRKGLEPRLII